MNRLEEALAALDNDVLAGAKALLGLNLVKGEMRARIVEVEAYRTPDDPACHAHRGVTPRNEVMFGPAGRAYVYFNYGVHWMLNVTAHSQGDAAAVLIRAAQPVNGLVEMRGARSSTKSDRDLLSGPGKLAAAYGIAVTGVMVISTALVAVVRQNRDNLVGAWAADRLQEEDHEIPELFSPAAVDVNQHRDGERRVQGVNPPRVADQIPEKPHDRSAPRR